MSDSSSLRKFVSPPPSHRGRPGLARKLRATGQIASTWAQVVGITLAGLWAVGVYYRDNVLEPKKRPSHLNVALDLEKAGMKDGHVAVRMNIIADNASLRTVYLLPAIYRIWGTRNDGESLDEVSFGKKAQENVKLGKDELVGRFSPESERVLIAVGNVFTSSAWSLRPGERVVRTAIVHVPRDLFDTVIATLSLPISHMEKGLSMEWNVLDLKKSKLYFQPDGESGERGEPVNWYDSGFSSRTGFIFATARSVLSLWEDEPLEPMWRPEPDI
jgi:hypothetical protein